MIISMVEADIRKWVSWGPITVYEIFGKNNEAAAVYIQLHQQLPASNTTYIANGTVPLVKAFTTAAGAEFHESFPNGLALKNLIVGMSSTEPSFTAVAANGGLDFSMDCEVDSHFLVDGSEFIIGDLTTGVDERTIWTDAAGPFSLLTLDIENGDADAFAMIFADTTGAADGHRPDLPVIKAPLGSTSVHFGRTGVVPRIRKNVSGTMTSYDGCKVCMSSTANVRTLVSGSLYSIRGIYKEVLAGT